MKKEWQNVFFLGRLFDCILLSSIIVLLSLVIVPCIQAVDICGESYPGNSSVGRGSVIICGVLYPCGASDGVCPEDYIDSTSVPPLRGNCENCTDVDCNLRISGYVRDTGGVALPGANVSVQLAAFRPSVLTDASGYYMLGIQPGRFPITAAKEGFDTVVYEDTFVRGNIYEHNFTLPLGVCNPDCTNSFNRCSAQCDGITFNYSTDTRCAFPSVAARSMCNDKIKGVRLFYGINTSDGKELYVTCCEGPITESFSPIVKLGGDIQNVVKYSRIVTYKGQPVKLNVVVWDGQE